MQATWRVEATRILTRSEVAAVLADLKRKARRSVNTRLNLTIFRLATCCGLRASEIAGLRLANVRAAVQRPHILIPKSIGKGRRSRRVPLWWDAGTLADVAAWKAERERQGAKADDYFVCAQSRAAHGKPIDRRNVRLRFIRACGVLGSERQADLTIHDGRHSFVSHALAAGRTLAEVRDAAGHSSVSTTSIYTHIAVADDGAVGNAFAFGGQERP